MPAMIPEWIEYVKGTTVTVRNDGIATRRLSQSMARMGDIMKAPMRTRGTAVATCGIELSSGVMKADTKKSTDTTKAERPVLAPSMMPALLSFAIITGLVPSRAPHIVPSAALQKIEVLLGTDPFRSRPAISNRPYCTPARSKRATKNRTKLPMTMPWSFPLPGIQPEKSTQNAASDLGTETSPWGASPRPMNQEMTAIELIPISRAPWTPFTSMAEMRANPATASQSFRLDHSRSPSVTRVSGDMTTSPITWKPINAWKIPMAAVIAFLRCSESTLDTTQWQTPHKASTRRRSPLTKQQLSACCHDTPKVWQMPKAKYAFKPMPGIRPRGASPATPAMREPKAADNAVAVMTESGISGWLTSALLRMTGFTTMM
mmetsp:Transcript_25713/g.74383  ORF Transcript_25713/g.74383 Transcript_25713/m.74383 type:complete len:375 (+) Transcript_25713:486-1610(+)